MSTPMVRMGVLFEGVILLWTASTAWSCGGSWQTIPQDWRIAWDLSSLTLCDYSYSGVKSPADVRSDTQYIKLLGNGIHDGDLNVTLLYTQVPELLAINLDNNFLTMIPDLGLFSATLRYISVNNNNITSVDFGTFHIFPLLRSLGLGENNLGGDDIKLNTEATILPLLYSVEMYSNAITNIQWSFVTNTPNLQRIDFSQNHDIYITGPGSNAIKNILLNGCYTAAKGVFNFTMVKDVASLDIRSNQLAGIEGEPGDVMANAETLNIGGNLWTVLDLQRFNSIAPNLVTLQADNNQITEVLTPKDSRTLLPYLATLILSNNPLTVLGYYCSSNFGRLPNGLQIDLSDTKLYCGEQLLWLLTCPYAISMGVHLPVCHSPMELQGRNVTDVCDVLLKYTSKKDQSWSFRLQEVPELSNKTGHVFIRVRTHKGLIQCSRLCAAIQGRSFTYSQTGQSCVVYHDQSGSFVTD